MPPQTITEKCGYGSCGKEFVIPKEIADGVSKAKQDISERNYNSESVQEFLRRPYDEGFFVSGCGRYYCNKECAHMFTES